MNTTAPVKKTKIWTSPTLAKLGRIEDVAAVKAASTVQGNFT